MRVEIYMKTYMRMEEWYGVEAQIQRHRYSHGHVEMYICATRNIFKKRDELTQ